MKVLCFGDSNTYGFDPRSYGGGRYPPDARWVDLLAARTGWEVHNLGENGRCIPQRAVPLAPDADLLIVMLGSNDLLQGCTPAQAAARMRRFLLGVTLPPQRILLLAPPPMARGAWVPDGTLVEASRALAQQYRALAAALGIRFADAGRWATSLAFDGVHLTGQGHRALAEGLLQEVVV